jgi:hypothetical protein
MTSFVACATYTCCNCNPSDESLGYFLSPQKALSLIITSHFFLGVGKIELKNAKADGQPWRLVGEKSSRLT